MTTIVRRLRTAAATGGVLLLGAPWAGAQTPPAPAASAAGGEREYSISDRVKKDAASPLYWIRLNAQKPDANGAKTGPKITEVRPVAPAGGAASPPRPVAANPAPAPTPAGTAGGAATASTPPPTPAAVSATAAATPPVSGGGNVPAPTAGNAPSPVASGGTAPAGSPPAPQAGANAGSSLPGAGAGITAAGLAGGSAPSATDAARAAAAASTAAADQEDDEQPLALLQAGEPEFSAVAMRRLRKGNVQVKFDVLPDGRVANATVVQTTNRTLNEAALEAVSGWLFKPVRSPRSAVVDLGFDLDS